MSRPRSRFNLAAPLADANECQIVQNSAAAFDQVNFTSNAPFSGQPPGVLPAPRAAEPSCWIRKAEALTRNTPGANARAIAQQLLAYEAATSNLSEAKTNPAVRVCEKLRRSISTLAGATGFRVLFARALALAKKQAPGLEALHVQLDGSLNGLNKLSDVDAAEAGALVVAQLLGLLDIFIGENLMLRLIDNEWPDLPALDGRTFIEKAEDDPRQ